MFFVSIGSPLDCHDLQVAACKARDIGLTAAIHVTGNATRAREHGCCYRARAAFVASSKPKWCPIFKEMAIFAVQRRSTPPRIECATSPAS
jgi:hypothetical protein